MKKDMKNQKKWLTAILAAMVVMSTCGCGKATENDTVSATTAEASTTVQTPVESKAEETKTEATESKETKTEESKTEETKTENKGEEKAKKVEIKNFPAELDMDKADTDHVISFHSASGYEVTLVPYFEEKMSTEKDVQIIMLEEGVAGYKVLPAYYTDNNISDVWGCVYDVKAMKRIEVSNYLYGKSEELIVAITEYMTGIGAEGTIPQPVVRVYERRAHAYELAAELSQSVNDNVKAEDMNMDSVVSYIKQLEDPGFSSVVRESRIVGNCAGDKAVFNGELSGYGKVQLIAYNFFESGYGDATYHIVQEGRIVYTLPAGGEYWELEGVEKIECKDVDGDGDIDIIVSPVYCTGIGAEGMETFVHTKTYTADGMDFVFAAEE